MTRRLRAFVAHAEKPTRQRLLAQLRGQHGVEVIGDCCDANALREALTIASDSGAPVDLLFLDMELPGANRVDLLTAIIRAFPGGVPAIVIVTADGAQAMRALKDGAAACVLKPFSDEGLEKALRRAIGATGYSAPKLISTVEC